MARPRSFDEAQVLAAAREQFWETGYAATSVDDLMKATGLGKGSLYGAFGDKRTLFLRVLDGYATESLAAMAGALTSREPAVKRVSALLRAAAQGAAGDLGARGCLLVNSTAELNRRDPEVQQCARRVYGVIEDLLTECLAEAQGDGDVRSDADPRAQARVLLAVMQGMEFLGKTGMPAAALEQVATTALANL
jgi:AcrR family transcriptional regulator